MPRNHEGRLTASDITPEQRATMRDHVIRWRRDPAAFCVEQFKVTLDPAQVEFCAALGSPKPEHQRIAMQAAAGTAKSAMLAMGTLWFSTVWGDAKWAPCGAAVSISEKNLHDNFVKELAIWRGRSALCTRLLDLNSKRLALVDRPDTGFISFRSFPDGADENAIGATMSGLHGPYVWQVIDEAGDVPPAIGRTTEQARTKDSIFCKTAVGGNPVSTEGLLHEIATNLRHLWHLIVVTGDPDDPRRSPRVPIEKARLAIETYGRENAWVRIYILGLFPLTALNKFLGPDDITRAMRRNYSLHDYVWAQNRLGVDPARFGDDRTGFVRRQGVVMWRSQHLRGATSSEIAAFAANLNAMPGVGPFDLVLVDAGGPNSGGAIDQMRAARLNVLEVHSSGKPPDEKFWNNRAYMEWQAAEWVKQRGQFPDDRDMAREAVASTYDFKNGKLIVQSKDDIKGLPGGISPDLWDSGKLTFAVPDAPKGMGVPAGHPMMGPFDRDEPHIGVMDTMPPWAAELQR
jgi:hypothetical protein